MFLCLTANHRNASFDLLEKLSFGAPTAAGALVASKDFVTGAVVLATCNRFEAYLEIEDPDEVSTEVAIDATVSAMSSASGIDPADLREVVHVHTGSNVAKHLFAVSSGLESVVIGEDEISGQVRRALERARVDGTTSRGLERLFQRAAHTSRGVKNQTAIGGAGRSLVRLALDLAASRIVDWSATSVLIVGTGQYAATTVVALRDRGVHDIRVFSPSGRGAPFAARHSLDLQTSLRDAILAAGVVITCTSNLAIGAQDIIDEGSRLVIDLGLPRNVAPEIAGFSSVQLLDLETISLHAPLEELSAHDEARTIVGDAAATFVADQSVAPAVVALRAHINGLLDAEIERARGRGDLSEATESAMRHLVGVLLHTPSVRARELAKQGESQTFTAGVEALYGIVPEAPATDVGVAEERTASA